LNIAIVSPLRVNTFTEGYCFFEDFPELFKNYEDVREIHVFFFTRSKGRTYFSNDFYLHTVSMPLKIDQHPILLPLSIFLCQLNLLVSLLKIIKAYNVNIIEANDVLLTGPPSLLAAKLSRRISTLYVAGPMEETIKHKLGFLKMKSFTGIALKFFIILKKMLFSNVDHVFCVTRYLIEDAKKYGAKSVSWTPTDVNAKIFKPMNISKEGNKPRILYIGRLDPDKGVSYLIDAFNIVRSQVDAELHLIGAGLEREKLEKKVVSLGLSDSVYFRGIIHHRKIPVEINKCDVIVLPSFSEGIPRIAVEAALCLKPIILTPICSASGFFEHGVHAMIVPPGNAYELARAIIRVLTDKTLRERLVINAQDMVRRKLLSYGEEHIRIYRTLYILKGK